MAQLKSSVVQGSLRVTDTTYTDDLVVSGSKTARYALIAPTSNGAPTWRALTNADVGLGNVENTKLSTWVGTSKITTVGTITSGTWSGTKIGIEHGGTNATTAADARTNLGLGSIATKADTAYVKYAGNITGVGKDSPASGAQTWWKSTTNVPKLSVIAAYNNSGSEKTLIFSKGNADATYGSILMWGYADKYLYILRKNNSNADTWKSTDWEKIDAGYADSAGNAATATSAGKATNDSDGNAINTTYVKKISSTDNAIVKFDGTNGAIQNSGLKIDDNNHIILGNAHSIFQNQNSSSNYTSAITWKHGAVGWIKEGTTYYTYQPQIGQHNTGGDGTGSIVILPYATDTSPWGGSVGLFIRKGQMSLDNNRIPHTGNTTGSVGGTTTPVYVDGGQIKSGTALGTAAYKAVGDFAAASHGTHVTAATVKSALGTDSSTTTKWLNQKGEWSTPTAANVGALASTTKYAASGSVGGSANSALQLHTSAPITIQTGSTKKQPITLETLMTWLITTKKYIPSDSECYRYISTTWSYANNDILRLTCNGINYELQLAGCVIEFWGTATSYNAGMFRLGIHSSPSTSFTATSGYTKFPTSSYAEYTCNGSDYSPAWRITTATTTNSKPTLAWDTTSTIGTVNGINLQVTAMAKPTKSDIGLGNVEDTKLSTWAGSANITKLGTIATGTWQGTAIAATYIGNHSTDKLTSGTLPVTRGGTGLATSTYKNAVVVGNASTVTNAFHTIRTGDGAFYATAQDGAPSFGTLPIAQGGTGKTSAADAWTALGGGASGKHADSYFIKAITSTDGDIPRFDGTGGQLQSSRINIDDTGFIKISYNGRYPGDTQYSNAAGKVGEFWLDTGHATNVTSPRFYWAVWRPKETADTTTESTYEAFRLPAATAGTAKSVTYDILTTKNTITVAQGGTGANSFTANSVIMSGNSTTAAFTTRAITNNTSATAVTASTNLITANTLYYHKGNSNIVTVGTITSGTWNGTTISTAHGGTGNTSFTQWGIIYANPATKLVSTAAGTAGYLLQGNGSAAPSWIQATNANTASTIVKRDANKNFSAGTITATLNGNASTATAANLTTTADTFAIFSNTTGTFADTSLQYWQGTAKAGKNYTGWIKFASINMNTSNHWGRNIYDIFLDRKYSDPASEVYSIRVSVGWTNSNIIQLSGQAGKQIMTKFRIVRNHSTHKVYFEYYVNPTYSTTENDVNIKILCYHGAVVTLMNEVQTETDSTFAYKEEISLANGMSNIISDTSSSDSEASIVCKGKAGQIHLFSQGSATGAFGLYSVNASGKERAVFMCSQSGDITTGYRLFGAVWNDYAEYRQANSTEPGRVVIENGNDTLVLSTTRLQPGAEIISDTFGFAIGQTDSAKTPIATSGRVLAYPYESREEFKANIGKPVCSGPNGTVSIMTQEEYEKYGYCAIGTISAVPDYEEWGSDSVAVNGRVWIRVR